MPKYEVRLYDTYIRTVTVEAESHEAAIKQARNQSAIVHPESVKQGDDVGYEVRRVAICLTIPS